MLKSRDAVLNPARASTGTLAVQHLNVAAPAASRLILYWVTTVVATLAFNVPGVLNLIRAPHVAQDMAHLGYPPYFLTILGTWKVLGGIVVAAPRLPRLKEWAYAGMIFDLTGAALSRAIMGDGAPMVIVPLLIACVVLTSWSLRPESRRLQSPNRV
jgi:uncharacterized membrane protein YphA (DoxX/SURF4 family)